MQPTSAARSPVQVDEERPAKTSRIGYARGAAVRSTKALSLFAAIEELPEESGVVDFSIDFEEEELHSFSEDPHVFLTQAAIKKRAEVSMRNASPELKEAMKEAKYAEVQTWLANEVSARPLRGRSLASRL